MKAKSLLFGKPTTDHNEYLNYFDTWNMQCNYFYDGLYLEFPYTSYLVNWYITRTVIFFFLKMNLKTSVNF